MTTWWDLQTVMTLTMAAVDLLVVCGRLAGMPVRRPEGAASGFCGYRADGEEKRGDGMGNPLDPAGVDLLFERLRQLHVDAGAPSTREIARLLGKGVLSHSSVHAILRGGGSVPRWGPVELVVRALGGDEAEFRKLWIEARAATGGPDTDVIVDDGSLAPLFSRSVDTHRAAAERHYQCGDYRRAEEKAALMIAAATSDIAKLRHHVGSTDLDNAGLRSAFEVQVEAAGAEDADTLRTRHQIALRLFDQGHADEALTEAVAVWDAQRTALGDGHADTLRTAALVGWIASRAGAAAAAETDLRAAYHTATRELGAMHSATLQVGLSLGSSLMFQGRHSEALELLGGTVGAYRERLGHEHPQTLLARNYLGRAHVLAGRLDDAERELADLLAALRCAFGDHSMRTLMAWNNLALTWDKQERLAEAEAAYREVLRLRAESIGQDHPETLRTRNNLAYVLAKAGRLPEAIVEYGLTLKGRRETLGEDHDSTLRTMSDLANAILENGDTAASERLLRSLADLRRRAHGEFDTRTLAARRQLVYVLSRMQRFDEAAREYAAVWEATRDASLHGHPDDVHAGPSWSGREP